MVFTEFDYLKLNAVTIKDMYPLPNLSMLFDKLAGCSFFSKLDLRWGCFQVQTAQADVEKLQRWLRYYRSFIPKYAHITAPLTNLLKDHPAAARPKSGARLQWLPAHQQAFEAIRLALASPPLLRLFDPQLPS